MKVAQESQERISSSRRSLILDPIHPRDFLTLNLTYCCEQCSHFDEEAKFCTIGYEARQHLKEAQNRLYEQTGRVAFCRFMEID